MSSYKKIFILIIPFSLFFCASKQKVQATFPQEIETVYFQKWIGGQEQTGSGTNFHIIFKKALSKEIQLNKIYFQNQEATFDQENEATFVAHFYQQPKNDIILDVDPKKEIGNKPPKILKPKYNLKPNEAIVEYTKNNKKSLFKIKNIKERELIAYPSMRRQDN
jgi:hypothetical protein